MGGRPSRLATGVRQGAVLLDPHFAPVGPDQGVTFLDSADLESIRASF
jgi:hypothetical protein